jgi:hypothetical protein
MSGARDQREDPEANLIAEQLRHTIDLLRAELSAVKAEQAHIKAMSDHRLAALEEARKDHETRLRDVTAGVTQFKVWAGLASGGSGLISLAALLRAWLG